MSWAAVAGRAVHRSVVHASPGADKRRKPRFKGMDVPLPRRSPMTSAHVMLDELVVGGFHAIRGSVTPQDLDRIEEETTQALAIFRARGWLANPRSFHRDPISPEAVASGRRRVGTSVFETLRFASGWTPHWGEPGRDRWLNYEQNARVRVLMLRHQDGPRPWVVCVHGAEMGGRPVIDTRILRARHLYRDLGLNVVIPVLPLHGPRRPRERANLGFPGFDFVDDVHGLAQAAWDVRSLLAWIRTQEPTAIGVNGFSMGGYVTALVAGLDQPLDAVIAGCPAVDLPALFRRNAPRGIRDDDRMNALLAVGEQLFRVVSPLSFRSATPAERSFLYGGLADRLADPVEQVAELGRHWGEPNMLWFDGGHVTHAISSEVSIFVDSALRRSLGVPQAPVS